MESVVLFFNGVKGNSIFELVAICVVVDTLFGCLRAIKHHKFNSSFGIDGAIRKAGMLFAAIFMFLVDEIININLIGFIPDQVLAFMPLEHIGVAEFFCILFIAYEVVSILKNMALCGLPVKNVWKYVRAFLGKYTDELPDADELDETETKLVESEVK